jgi:hypothetical protein
MTDFERDVIYKNISEHLSGASEILEEGNIDIEADEDLSIINDLIGQLYAIVGRE